MRLSFLDRPFWSLLLAILVHPARAQADVSRFAPGTLAEVRAAAKAAGKGLVVDFSSDAIEPCRRLLQTTWSDASLWRAIGDRALVARVDPERDAAAKEFALSAYPTLVLFDEEGAEVERIVGYIDAVSLKNRLAAGLQVLPTDYQERLALAESLARKGDADGALEHYLWLWQHGLEHNQGFGGVRVSFFLSDFVQFGKKHPPAWQALEKLRDDLARRAIGGEVKFEVVSDLVHLARSMRTPETLLDVFDKTRKAAWDDQPVARDVFHKALVGILADKGRAADAVACVGDPLKHLEGCAGTFAVALPMPEQLRAQMRRDSLAEQAGLLRALFQTHDARTKAFVDRMLELDPDASTWLVVLKAAKASGDDVACQDYAVRALQELPEADHAKVRAFLRRR
ncbi:MAG: thioredoxin family protein [Planctomycetota bacterium]